MTDIKWKEHGIIFSAPMVRQILAGKKRQTRRLVEIDKLRARLPEDVHSDLAFYMPRVTANAGVHKVRLNPHGAVTIAKLQLGLKPGEFTFVCPYATGPSVLEQRTPKRERVWTIRPEGNERLWVREKWRTYERPSDGLDGIEFEADGAFVSIENTREASEQWIDANDNDSYGMRWRNRMFMPRWASRIDLIVASVTLERLHDLTEQDAIEEGVEPFFTRFPDLGRDQKLVTGEYARDAEHRASYACLWDELNGSKQGGSWHENPWVWAVTFAVARIASPAPEVHTDWSRGRSSARSKTA